MSLEQTAARSRAGVSFRETMSGGFALGETDPAAGARRGAREVTPLVLRASLSIADVDAFVRDTEHAGTIDGTVTFAPLGVDMAGNAGRFRLFVGTGDPELKRMEYVLTFHNDRERFCLEGAKEVRRGSPLRGWAETTTLRCRLHAGGDVSGPIVGAGVLRISFAGFVRQVLSFRTTSNAPVAGAGALAAFLGFFAGELLDSYVWPIRRTAVGPS